MNHLSKGFLFLLLFLFSNFSFAQIIGGRANGEQSPNEVGASALSKGAVSGDVNLFNGTYGSSYTLGTVTSPGGVSYTQSLSYSSSFASGGNLPNTSGIPYGEGWNMDLPMISVSMEDYNEYTLKELANKQYKAPFGETREEITFTHPRREGELMWFAPTLSIPGVASGRLVYKYTQRYKGELLPVFVLHQFDQYIEARFDDYQWIVTTDDGTEYHMAQALVSQRSPQNRRTQEEEPEVKDFITPKEETTKWYVYKISHPNKNGTVNFRYDRFGAFDLFAEHDQHLIRGYFNNNSGNQPGAKKTYYQDLYLKEIYSLSEKLVLKHQSLYNHNMTGVYEVSDTTTTRKDSLYTSKTVLNWGGTNTPFNQGGSQWKRYAHLKSDAVQNVLGCSFSATSCLNRYSMSSTNPFQGSVSSINGVTSLDHLVMSENNESNLMHFNHSFVESPTFGQDFTSGDWYEIKTNISDSKGLFDINLVTGDKNIPERYLNGIFANSVDQFRTPINNGNLGMEPKYLVHSNTWKAKRLETVYSTLNQGMKWGPAATLHGYEISTSNYFRMPNLPGQLRDMYLQVGPANADVNHNSTLDNQLAPYNNSPLNINMPEAYFYNQFNFNLSTNPLWHGHNVPANFGNGMPWQMTMPIYGTFADDALYYSYQNLGQNYQQFWWNNDPYTLSTFPNEPTLADENSQLNSVELIHHAKNPYMLHEVSFYKLNGLQSSGIMEDDWQLVHKERFHYKPIKVQNFPHYKKWDGNQYVVENQVGTNVTLRNIVLLDKIQQLPIDETVTLPASKLPTTHFEYYEPNAIGNYTVDIPEYHSNVNINLALLKNIIDPLGGETNIVYKSTPVVVRGFSQVRRPKACEGCPEDFNPYISINGPGNGGSGQLTIDYKKAEPYSYTFNALVDKKAVKDAYGLREWDYQFEDIRYYDQYLPMPENLSWDKQHQTKYGFEKTTVTGPELVSGNRPYTTTYQYNLPADFDIGLGKGGSISEPQHLLWGKTYKVEEFDGNGTLLSKTENNYAYSKAFTLGKLRAMHNTITLNYNGNYPLGHDYVDVRDPSFPFPDTTTLPPYTATMPPPPANISTNQVDSLVNYYNNNTLPTPAPVSVLLIASWINYYNQVLLPYYQTGLDNGFGFEWFQRPEIIEKFAITIHPFAESSYATEQDYLDAVALYEQYRLAYREVRRKFYEGFSVSAEDLGPAPHLGNSYEYHYDTLIHSRNPFYSYSYFVPLASQTKTEYERTITGSIDSIQTITEYSYYDADETGMTNSEGYDILLHGNTNWQELQWEPSWQLYKTKTYSPQRPDAYSESELFYYYDLMNRDEVAHDLERGIYKTGGGLDDGNDGQFYPLHWSWKYNMRDIAFEERITQKAPGQSAITQSRYFDFTNEWNDIKFEFQEYGPTIIDSICLVTVPNDTMSHDTIINGNHCVQAREPDCYDPDPGYIVEHANGNCYLCWTGNYAEKEINLGFPLKSKLLYHDTRVQTTINLSGAYTAATGISDPKYSILRFLDDGLGLNNFVPKYPYDEYKMHEVKERNIYGAVTIEADEKGLETKYVYTGIKTQNYSACYNGVQTSVSYYIMELVNTPIEVIVGVGLPDSLRTVYTYNDDYTIESVMAPNDLELSYEYDVFGRMHKGFRNGVETAEIAYHQWNNDKNKSFEQRTLDNYVQTKTYLDAGGTKGQVARAYMDPLGRNNLTSTHDLSNGNKLIVAGGMDYDNWDRPEKIYKSYLHQGDFSSLVYNNHQGYNLPFAENQYENTPRSRILKASKPGISITDPDHTVDQHYCLITGSEMTVELGLNGLEELILFGGYPAATRIIRTATTDEDDKQNVVFTNVAGQQLATKGNDGTQAIVTLFYYDSKGQLTGFSNPEKQLTNYHHNLLGQLYQKETVDNGITRYVYNPSGQVVYEQDAKGAQENYMRTRRYDIYGRLTTQDYFPITNNNVDAFENFNAKHSLHQHNPKTLYIETGYTNLAQPEKKYFYGDSFDPVQPDFSPETQGKLMEMDNNYGLLSHTVSFYLDGTPVEYRFLSYNDEGFLDWEITQYRQEGISAQNHGTTNLISYPEYNLPGSLLTQEIDLGADGVMDIQYHNTYDAFNRLEAVYVNYDDLKANGQKVVEYEYDEALGLVTGTKYFASGGRHKNYEIDEIVHAYDIRDRLTTLESALFAWKMYYDDNQAPGTTGQASWNGNITSTLANYKLGNALNATDLSAFAHQTKYNYTYDGINRLVNANATGFSAPSIGDAAYQYDKIGNLLSLNRTKQVAGSAQTQQLGYAYAQGANHLTSVTETGLPNRAFSYDPNGNLLTDTKKELTQTNYGRANLPQVLTQGVDTTISYIFDVNDMRIGKQVDKDGKIVTKDFYLRDASGKEVAVINQNGGEFESIDWNIYGMQRVAQLRHQLAVTNFALDVKVLLEGPANGLGTMSNDLNHPRQVLPGMMKGQTVATPAGQPYNTAPWNYDGTEGIDFTNADYAPTVVDWVLVSLRTDLTKESEVFKTAALLHQDGHIDLIEGRLPPNLPPVHIAVEHRNHMGAITPQPITMVNGVLTYDFTAANSYAGVGAGQKQHPTSGLWMLYAGNSANSQTGYDINGSDQTVWNHQNGLFSQYLSSDYNMDGDVTGQDKTIWIRNNGLYSQMEPSEGGVLAPSNFIYYIYDHLGNTRVAYSVDISGTNPLNPPTIDYTVSSAVDYFPYGAELRSYGKSRYLTTQHERDLETGFDYRGARFYDSEVGRFLSVDPLASEYPSYSDYAYVAGNPIIFIDPDGRNTIYYDEDGNEIGRSEDELDNAVVVISNDNLELFKANSEAIFYDKDANISAELKASFLRGFGINYMVDGMMEFLDNTKKHKTTEHDYFMPGHPTGRKMLLSVEAGSYLYLNDNGQVVIGSEEFISDDVEMTGWGDPEDGKSPKGKLHTHPNSGVTVADNRGYEETIPESTSALDRNHESIDGYYNVVVDNKNIYFYAAGKKSFEVEKQFFNKQKK